MHDRHTALPRLDRQVAATLNDYIRTRPEQASLWRAISDVFQPSVLRVVLLLAGLVLWLRAQRRAAVLCVGTALGTLLLSTVLKDAFGRARPHVPVVIATASGASFPSGHALTSAAAAATLLVLSWRRTNLVWRAAMLGAVSVIVLAVGFSRLVLGVHYLSDVLAGWCVALALVAGLWCALGQRLPPATKPPGV